MTIDDSEIQRLSHDLGRASRAAQRSIRRAVQTTADEVKAAWNNGLYSSGHAKLTGRAITYETTERPRHGVDAEIGAVRGQGRQAGVVRLLENGSVHNAPHGAGGRALEAAEPRFLDRLNTALRDAEGDL